MMFVWFHGNHHDEHHLEVVNGMKHWDIPTFPVARACMRGDSRCLRHGPERRQWTAVFRPARHGSGRRQAPEWGAASRRIGQDNKGGGAGAGAKTTAGAAGASTSSTRATGSAPTCMPPPCPLRVRVPRYTRTRMIEDDRR
eukprot:COSAG05_NODE_2738_length_2706_cov_5.319141_1_plen_141_part_00